MTRADRIAQRKFAITGAGRGLGAALAITMAQAGARLVLLARSTEALQDTATAIQALTGDAPDLIACDLADAADVARAGTDLARRHADLDGLIHNGAMWLPGTIEELSDGDIHACIASAASGALILTRHALPVLRTRDNADIHVVVSTSGLPNHPLSGGSVAFTAAKSAQAGLVTGLTEELAPSNVRVTSVFPGDFTDVTPGTAEWDAPSAPGATLSTRDVVAAILFALGQPPGVAMQITLT